MVENFKNRDLNVVVFKDGEITVGCISMSRRKHGLAKQNQISELVRRDIKTIGRHINNIFKEKGSWTKKQCAKYATTAGDEEAYKWTTIILMS